MTNYYGPMSFRSGGDESTVVDPRFGTGPEPDQPPGWGGSSGYDPRFGSGTTPVQPPGWGGGGASIYAGGARGAGFHVPPGSLNNLTAALANGATDQRVEISYMGDSSGWGSGPEMGGPAAKIRSRFAEEGLPDGGRGIVRLGDGSFPNPVVSQTGWGEQSPGYMWPPQAAITSTSPGDVITLTGQGTAIRLVGWNLHGLTYRVDSGSTVTPPSSTDRLTTVYIGPLTSGTHTITLTKVGTLQTGFAVEYLKGTGVTVHLDAVSGMTSGLYYGYRSARGGKAVANNTKMAYALGVKSAVGTEEIDWRQPPGDRPVHRNVKAACFALGLNDMSVVNAAENKDEVGASAAGVLAENTGGFIRMCRAGGVDPIVVVPHFDDDGRSIDCGGRFQSALVGVAEAMSAAWVDYNTALRLGGYPLGTGPHLATQAGYDIEGQFLFDNVLSLALPV